MIDTILGKQGRIALVVGGILTVGVLGADGADARTDDVTFQGPRLGANTITFGSLRAGNDDIYAVDIDGSGARRLTVDPGFDSAASSSPDRRRIAFGSDREGLMQVYVMDADGQGQRNLTNSDFFDYAPSWSRDGSRIFFQRGVPATGIDLWVMDADGTDQRRLTDLPRNEVGGLVSPDDSSVTFGGNNGGNQDVWTVGVDGTGTTNLTLGTCIAGTVPCVLSSDVHPSWTPDGRIVFVSDRSGEAGIWSMARDGSDPRLVRVFGSDRLGFPSVSANGNVITFVSDAHSPGGLRNVYTMQSDGTNVRRVTWVGDDLLPRFTQR